jgi:hypothetical protein
VSAQPEGLKDRVAHPLQRSVINPLVRTAGRLGHGPPGDALLETTGRRTGRPADFWRRICVQATRRMSKSLLTIRIDLDSP